MSEQDPVPVDEALEYVNDPARGQVLPYPDLMAETDLEEAIEMAAPGTRATSTVD
ncbi:hypothetical protein GCM10027445_51920 [Amycolatopsis endophytica]|uniref:Uncharacterized protein n=1 Tax=Amycolatopsis endophytica TaxID=860233 RepID=A0A853B8N2_9PSEU|nr:hypothetical protein [Amycolatopsis endophytica]NYI91673.1 hypothetical protein [Amycolatopsis endophytica]